MPTTPTPGGGPNQTLLELIFALRGLAETVEFYHKDLSQRLDEEAKNRSRELDQLRAIVAKNGQSMHVLPITMSNRVEKLLGELTTDLDHRFEDLSGAVSEVRQKLWQYMKVTERAISQADGSVEEVRDDKSDITGKVELMENGHIKVLLHSKLVKRIGQGILLLATAGGAYGLGDLLKNWLSG